MILTPNCSLQNILLSRLFLNLRALPGGFVSERYSNSAIPNFRNIDFTSSVLGNLGEPISFHEDQQNGPEILEGNLQLHAADPCDKSEELSSIISAIESHSVEPSLC